MEEQIIKIALELFDKNSVKFTLDDIAKKLKISKKTLYRYFSSKEELLQKTVDYVFNDINMQHNEILKTKSSPLAHLRKILSVYPTVFIVTGDKIAKLEELYPEIYKHILYNFSINWQLTDEVIDTCIAGGYMKPIDKECLRIILIGLFDRLLQEENQEEKLETCLDYIFNGILGIQKKQ